LNVCHSHFPHEVSVAAVDRPISLRTMKDSDRASCHMIQQRVRGTLCLTRIAVLSVVGTSSDWKMWRSGDASLRFSRDTRYEMERMTGHKAQLVSFSSNCDMEALQEC